jgi:hypothetical protein
VAKGFGSELKSWSPGTAIKGPRKINFHILGARIWVRFVRSQGRKTGGIASSFEDFAPLRAGEDGLKPGCIKGEIIFSWALRGSKSSHQLHMVSINLVESKCE